MEPLRWLPKALRNLDDELAHIAKDSPEMAALVAQRIFDAVALLPTAPQMGRPGRVAGTRELIVPKTRLLVPYRVRDGVIEILRVFHTSRRPPARW